MNTYQIDIEGFKVWIMGDNYRDALGKYLHENPSLMDCEIFLCAEAEDPSAYE